MGMTENSTMEIIYTPTSSELQVPPRDVSHKCANLKAGVYIISIVKFSTIPYINPNFGYRLGERYTNHTSILLPLNTISPPQNVFYKDHHKHKISLFFY